jgi:sec-independent protein translocase protein TatA
MRPSVWQIVLLVVVLLVLFGWRRLPDMARSVGQSLRIFKSEVEQMTDKDKDSQTPSAASTDTVRGDATGTPDSRGHAEERADPTTRHDGPAPRA